MGGNAADIILQLLSGAGVKSIYGVSGDAIFPLMDALARQDEVRYYSAVTETGAAFMASYEAKLTGRLTVCTATSGPGTVNLINGLADAFFDRAPVLALTGQVDTTKMGINTKQYFNQKSVMQNFTSFSETVVSPDTVIPIMQTAIETALNDRTTAHVSIPRDIFLKPLSSNRIPVVSGKSYTLGAGISGQLDQAVRILDDSHKLLVITGLNNRNVMEKVEQVAEKRDAGIVTAQHVQGAFSFEHPRAIGVIGQGYLPGLINEVDCILLVGEASYELNFLPDKVPVIQIADTTKSFYYDRIICGLVGNPAQILSLMLQRLKSVRDNGDWLKVIRREKEVREQTVAEDAQNNQVPIHPARLISALSRSVDEDAVIALDIGSSTHWFGRGFKVKNQTVLVSGKWRSMGSGLPAAIGAKIAQPEKQVIALIGDGGFLMSLAELVTAVRYNLPVTVIIDTNSVYSLEKHKMALAGLIPYGNELKVADFATFAEASGARGFRVSEPRNLEAVLTEAFNCNKPAVVDIRTADEKLPFLK